MLNYHNLGFFLDSGPLIAGLYIHLFIILCTYSRTDSTSTKCLICLHFWLLHSWISLLLTTPFLPLWTWHLHLVPWSLHLSWPLWIWLISWLSAYLSALKEHSLPSCHLRESKSLIISLLSGWSCLWTLVR